MDSLEWLDQLATAQSDALRFAANDPVVKLHLERLAAVRDELRLLRASTTGGWRDAVKDPPGSEWFGKPIIVCVKYANGSRQVMGYVFTAISNRVIGGSSITHWMPPPLPPIE